MINNKEVAPFYMLGMEGTIMQPKTISQGKSGEKFVTDIKTITAEEQKQFCHITANTLPIFLTDEAAQAKGWAQRLVPGAMTMSCSIGLMEQAGLLDDVIAFMAMEKLRYLILTLVLLIFSNCFQRILISTLILIPREIL